MTKGSLEEFYIVEKWGKYDVLRTITYTETSTRPSAFQLCAVLQAAVAHGREIGLDGMQCYWFANTIFPALQDIFPGNTMSFGRKEKKKGSHIGVKFFMEEDIAVVHQMYIEQLKKNHAVRDLFTHIYSFYAHVGFE